MNKQILDIKMSPEFRDEVLTSDDGAERLINGRKHMINRWKTFVNEAMKQRGISVNDVVKITGKSERTIKNWKGKIPAKRDSVICLGYALCDSEHDVNELLCLSLFPKLYVKNPDDAIWIYLINNKRNKFNYNISEIHENYRRYFVWCSYREKQSCVDAKGTDIMASELSNVHSDEDFKEFLDNHMNEFRGRYNKLLTYIKEWVGICPDESDSFYDGLEVVTGDKRIAHSLNQRIYRIQSIKYERNRIRLDVPKRDHIIALGIYLGMPVNNINDMLEICGMVKLGNPDLIIEAAILYILNDLESTAPDEFGIDEIDLERIISEDEYEYSRRRFVAEIDWKNNFGIAPLSDIRAKYYNGRNEFQPFSIAEYVAERMEESSIEEINKSNILQFL